MALPFTLLVNHNGWQHILRSPEDLPEFWHALQLGPIDLLEWYQEFLLPPLERRSPFASPEKQQSKKMKASRQGGSQAGTPNNKAHSSRAVDEY